MLTKFKLVLAAAILIETLAPSFAKDRVERRFGQPSIGYEEFQGHVPTNLYQGW
jgi:hypothetical protein